jgi:hypothetical protein
MKEVAVQKPTRVVALMTTIKCASSTDSAHHAIIRDAIYYSMHLYHLASLSRTAQLDRTAIP